MRGWTFNPRLTRNSNMLQPRSSSLFFRRQWERCARCSSISWCRNTSYLYLSIYIYLCIRPSNYLSFCLSIYLCLSISIYLSVSISGEPESYPIWVCRRQVLRSAGTWLVTTLTATPHLLLVTTLYFTNWPPDRCLFSCLQAPVGKMREMIIYQLVQGYKLYIYLPIYLSVHIAICQSRYLSTCIYLSVSISG